MINDLSCLLSRSSSTRSYFVSLPVAVQVVLHRDYSYIRTAAQLHDTAGILLRKHEKYT